MKIYRVIDDCTCVLTTFDELAALRLLKAIMEKHDVMTGWIDVENVH